MGQVDAVKTPYVAPVVAGAFVYAYTRVVGAPPPAQSSYLMPMAQSAVETGYWKSMFNNNAGNMTATSPNTQDWMFEYAGSHRFRSYSTLGAGAVDMVTWLFKHGALAFADANDLTGYVGALQRACYVGCPPEGDMNAYAAGISSAMHKYSGIVPVTYSEGIFAGMSTGSAIAIGAVVLAVGAGAAYALHEGFFDRFERRLGARENPTKLERCVRKVKRKGNVRNPWAVCRSSLKV